MQYINCEQRGNNLLLTYIHDNQVKYAKISDYEPVLFTENQNPMAPSAYKDLIKRGSLQPIRYSSIRDANDAIRDAHDMAGYTLYGNRNFNLTFLHENFKDMENYDPNMIRGFFFDIECPADHGFPDPIQAAWPINAMCIYDTFTKKYYVWGLGEYNIQYDELIEEGVDPKSVVYNSFDNEVELLNDMVGWWQQNYPAYVTGWNSETFDLPYLANRLQRLGIDMGRLSPWGIVTIREKEIFGKSQQNVYISGVASLDYLDLYKKNRFITRESYKLDHIAHVELGRKKVDYSEVAKDLRTLHKVDWNKYITYNIIDVNLVKELDDSLGFLDITFAVAYKAGINYNQVSSPVGTWENILYRELIVDGIVMPPKKDHDKTSFEGGYVKPPQVGKHRWVCSFDLSSLYSHITIGYNISPETITSVICPDVNVDVMSEGLEFQRPVADVAICPSGYTFRRDFEGIAGKTLQAMYNDRKSIKKEMLKHESNVERAEEEISRRGL